MGFEKYMISIVIPVYQRIDSIKGILSDISKQTYKNYEVVVVDDGSTDRTYDYCKEYADKFDNIKVISKEHSGVSETRNRGIEEAEGKYIAFVDSDDRIESDYLEKLINNVNHYDVIISSFDRLFYRDNKCIKKIDNYAVDACVDEMKQLSPIFKDLYLSTLIATVCCKLYKREKIIENNIRFDKNISIGEDLIFNADYLKRCNSIRCIDYRGYHYICAKEQSLTHKNDTGRYGYAKILYKASLELCNELKLDRDARYGVYDLHLRTCILNIEFACRDKSMPDKREYIQKIIKDEATQEAVRLSKPTTKEFNIYKVILGLKWVWLTEIFVKCRWAYKKVCGRA